MAYKIKVKKSEAKWKMGVYDKEGVLVDFGVYDSKKEALRDYRLFDKPRGRKVIIEQE